MMNVITEYAHKWRFEINDAKTKVMCMCETKPQRQLRVSRWGETWQCGGRTIAVADAYVYLGVTITPNLDFSIHISQLHHKLQPQKREAALLGVRSGGLPIDHAIHLWQAYVEPKFAYACGVWMHETNARAHSVVNQLLGMSPYDEASCEPPPCAALLETQLQPAHVLRVVGLLRFWRMVLSRPDNSILKRVWSAVDSHAMYHHPLSLNAEVRSLQLRYPTQLGTTVPAPACKDDWKELVNEIAAAEMRTWVASQTDHGGRLAEYRRINGAHGLAEYLSHNGLRIHHRRNIAAVRTQATSYIAAHAQHRQGPLFGAAAEYRHRYCTRNSCAGRCLLDDTCHVMLRCPAHAADRQAMVVTVDDALGRAAARLGVNHSVRSLRDAASDNERLRLLLGSPPYRHLCNGSEEYGEVLRASAPDFISAVHRTRWLGR